MTRMKKCKTGQRHNEKEKNIPGKSNGGNKGPAIIPDDRKSELLVQLKGMGIQKEYFKEIRGEKTEPLGTGGPRRRQGIKRAARLNDLQNRATGVRGCRRPSLRGTIAPP